MNYWVFPGIPQEAQEHTYWKSPRNAKDPLKSICNCVTEAFEVKFEDMVSPTRTRTVSEARHCFFFLSYKYTDFPMEELSRFLKRHRTSGIHSKDTAKDLLAVDKYFKKRFDKAEETLKTMINDTFTGFRTL